MYRYIDNSRGLKELSKSLRQRGKVKDDAIAQLSDLTSSLQELGKVEYKPVLIELDDTVV